MTAGDIDAQAILTPTLHGNTPKIVSRFRPKQPVIAVTPYESVRRRLLLYWGVSPIISAMAHDSDTMLENAINAAEKADYIHPFDKVIILAGVPVDSPIMLNTIRVHLHCRVLAKSRRGYGGRTAGRIVKVKDLAEAERRVTGSGDEILLTRYIDPNFYPVLKKIKGYILEEFSAMSYREIAEQNPTIVALAGTLDVLAALNDGQEVTIDGEEKLVYEGRAETP